MMCTPFGSGFSDGDIGFGYGDNRYTVKEKPFSWFEMAAGQLTRELRRSPSRDQIEQRANELFARARSSEPPESRVITGGGCSMDIGLYGLVS